VRFYVCPREKCDVYTLSLQLFTELKVLPPNAISIKCDYFE